MGNLKQWIILAFAALNVIFLGGKRRAFGSFVAIFHREYNTSLTELNWIGDSYSAFGYMTTGLTISIIMYFNRRYGLFQFMGATWVLISCITSSFVPNPHWLFLTHTLFHGIGSSLIISTAGLVVNEYFDKKHRYHLLATTLVSGGSVASIVFIYMFSGLIDYFNWRHSFLILGGIYFIVCGSAALFFRKNEELSEIYNKKQTTCQIRENVTPLHIPLIILWFIDRVMTSVVTYGLLLNLTDYVFRHHNNLVRSNILTTLFAAGEAVTYLIGAIITALTKDFFKEKLRYILLVTSMSMSACLILLKYFSINLLATKILCFIAGFSLGPSITFLFPAGEELTRLPGQIAYPISLGGMGFGMIISPLLTAQIAITYGFKWFFFIQGFMLLIKVACLIIIIVILCFFQHRLETIEYSDEDSYLDQKLQESILSETKPILSFSKNK